MSRWKAAAIHLSISATIGLLSAALIFGVWYPPPYSHAAGADELVLLLLGVDVVLGPLLTLVVFKAGKKSLKFDLGVVAVLQVCAFLYGMSVVVRARPAFIVAAVDRFVLVTASDLDDTDLAQGAKPEFQAVSWTGPRVVGAVLPTTAAEHNELLASGLAGKDLERFPKYYVDYSTIAQSFLAKAHPVSALRAKNEGARNELDRWLKSHGKSAENVRWMPLTSRRTTMETLLDAASGAESDAVGIDPW